MIAVVLLAVGRGRGGGGRIRRPPPEHWEKGPDNLGTQPLPALKDKR